jgi:putative transposase
LYVTLRWTRSMFPYVPGFGRDARILCCLHHCVHSLHYHLVLATKYRWKCLTGAMLDRLRTISSDRYAGWGGALVELNGERDHVHLLITLPPNRDLSRFVTNRKTASSRSVRNEFADELRAYDWMPSGRSKPVSGETAI